MAWILGAQETGEASDISHPHVPRVRRRSFRGPIDCGRKPNPGIAAVGSELGVPPELARYLAKLVTECLAK